MIEELDVEYRASMILLACAVAFIGTHSAIFMSEQLRLALSTTTSLVKIYSLVALASISLGGIGLNGTQYIIFQSIRLRTSDDMVIELKFNPYMIFGSMLVASFLTFLSICIACADQYFNKSQTEIMNIFLNQALVTRTIAEIKHMGKTQILVYICTSFLHYVLMGGIIVGGALCLSRYMSILAVEFPGTVEYNDGLLTLSIFLSFIGMIILYWIFFRIVSVFPTIAILRTSCSIIGMIVIVGVNYIRMLLTKFYYNPEKLPLPANSEDSSDIFIGILTTAILLSFLLQSYSLSGIRIGLQRISTQLYQADRALIAILNNTNHRNNTTSHTPPTMSTMATSRDSIRVRETTSMQLPAPPEVVSYAQRYLKPENLPVSLTSPVSPSLSTTSFMQAPIFHYDMDKLSDEQSEGPLPPTPQPLPTSQLQLLQPQQEKEEEKVQAEYILQQPLYPEDNLVGVLEEKEEVKEEDKEEERDFWEV